MGRLGSHGHIVTVFRFGQEGDQPFMVTELMRGGSDPAPCSNPGGATIGHRGDTPIASP